MKAKLKQLIHLKISQTMPEVRQRESERREYRRRYYQELKRQSARLVTIPIQANV